MTDQPPPSAKEQPIIRHRLTVVEKLYHQTHGGEPTCVESTYEVQLQTDEEVYARQLAVNETPTKLDLGWLNDKPINQIVIHNKETSPTKPIFIGFEGSETRLIVLPGQSSRFLPSRDVVISSASGSAKCRVQVIPG